MRSSRWPRRAAAAAGREARPRRRRAPDARRSRKTKPAAKAASSAAGRGQGGVRLGEAGQERGTQEEVELSATSRKAASRKKACAQEEEEIADADTASHDRPPGHDREDLGRLSGARRVHVRSRARRQQGGDPPGDRAAVRRQGHGSLDRKHARQNRAKSARPPAGVRTGRRRS